MRLSHITISGFKSFAKKTTIDVTQQVTGVVGPNGSGKSNIAEAIRFVLGEQSMKSMRGKIGSDVIFKGSEHLAPLSRATVTMTIDNRKKDGSSVDTAAISQDLAPYLVYDELVLSRAIYADGTSDYTLNDAKVRLKDVQELLSFAGIGGSAHTIINQGEADRILLASPKDKKEALEDALGLRVYHMRLNESARKLEKVKTHVREVELLRQEIKPHLEHLGRQVKKIESQEEERKKLYELLIAYFHREDKELASLRERINEQGSSSSLLLVKETIEKELRILETNKNQLKDEKGEGVVAEKQRLHAEVRLVSEKRDQVTKTLGRLEAERSYVHKELHKDNEITSSTISHSELKMEQVTLTNGLTSINRSLLVPNIEAALQSTEEVINVVDQFFAKHIKNDSSKKEMLTSELEQLDILIREHEETFSSLSSSLATIRSTIDALDKTAENAIISHHEEEKKVMMLTSKLRELESTIQLCKQEESELSLRMEHYNALFEEGIVIVGRMLIDYKTMIPNASYDGTKKQDLMRAIERSKLRIEEAGVPNKDEIISEYNTTKERDEYLTKELSDIKETEEKLLLLINELTTTLSERFSSGVKEVSKVFSEFFAEVFPGGKAKLSVVALVKIDEEGNQITEEGIELDVNLPNKKVKEISMFSGGERALVSIALLFAMSAITPPPFMVLDETDAPLDESNARKYGSMLKRLAENSKLLVITHNRETMNHCDMLYGVTIGVDGSSKLLSINFKQAEALAQ